MNCPTSTLYDSDVSQEKPYAHQHIRYSPPSDVIGVDPKLMVSPGNGEAVELAVELLAALKLPIGTVLCNFPVKEEFPMMGT